MSFGPFTDDCRRRAGTVILTTALITAAFPGASFSADLISASWRIRGGVVVSGASSVLAGPTHGAAGTTIGEGIAVGKSVGEETGLVVRGGFWPVTAGAAPDVDRDLIPNAIDDCPFAYDPGQLDRGGIGTASSPDGIGDACQCGDVNGDGSVTIADALVLTRSFLVPPTSTVTKPDLCDVTSPGGCSISDAVAIRRSLLRPPTAEIVQRCRAATPR